MRITNQMVTNSILNEVQQLDTQQSNLQAEVSSGLAVTQPSDNPSVFGQVVELEGQSSQLTQWSSNASTALNQAQASYSGLQSLTQIYDSAVQAAEQGSSVDGTDAASAGAEQLDQLIQQAVQVANTQYGGNYIYGGTAVTSPPFTTTTDSSGEIQSVTYVGNSQQASIPLSATSSVAPGTSGTTNAGIASLINTMISARDALQSGDSSSIATAQVNLNNAEDTLSSAVADNGAIQLRIQSDQTQEQSSSTEVGSLITSQVDADLPTTMTQLSQAELAYQAALESASRVMQLSLVDYLT